jgi:hypothetical protein
MFATVLLATSSAYAGDAGEWFDRAVRAATPIGLSAALLGFIVIGIAHSSMAAAEWAQRHERGAVKGAIYSIGATGLVNLVRSIVS